MKRIHFTLPLPALAIAGSLAALSLPAQQSNDNPAGTANSGQATSTDPDRPGPESSSTSTSNSREILRDSSTPQPNLDRSRLQREGSEEDRAKGAANADTNPAADGERRPGTTSVDPTMRGGQHRNLVAVLVPTEGHQTRGVVVFESAGNEGVRVTANLTGLEPNAKHGMHIHEYGDISSPDGSSAGSHFNPEGKEHGLPDGEGERHPGDFGNIEADGDGNATLSLNLENLSLAGDAHSIIGRAVIVHAKEDKGTQPDGDAGPRIAQGVIAVGNPMKDSQDAGTGDGNRSDAEGVRPGTNREGRSEENSSGQRTNEGAGNSQGNRAPVRASDRTVAEEIGRGAKKAAQTTVKVIERGAEEVGEAIQDVGRGVEKAIK